MFTKEEIDRYTCGQCWVLAWHIHQLVPDKVRIIDFNEHVLVQIGDEDKYLDVTGVHTKEELRQDWKDWVDKMHPIAYDLTKHILKDPEHPENVQAREVAKKLVNRYLGEIHRVSGECPCIICGNEYRKHAYCTDKEHLSGIDGQPFLRVACDGRLLKL